MNQLSGELHRLYGLGTDGIDPGAAPPTTGHAGHGVRVAVLEVALPAGWEQLSTVWRGVQADLELPAPAIAVSGADAVQLWFSFATPLAPSAGARFVHALRKRYLFDIRPSLVRVFAETTEIPVAPCVEVSPEHWSAFILPDLIAVFAETPWLDLPPGEDGQAAILQTLQPIQADDLKVALTTLGETDHESSQASASSAQADAAAAGCAGEQASDPARFLAGVMNDKTAPLALRIEAARVLLSVGPGRPSGSGGCE